MRAQPCDNALLFGELTPEVLRSLDAALVNVFQPAFVERDDWGQADGTEVQEFNKTLDKFMADVHETIQSVSGGLELRCPDENFVAAIQAAQSRGGTKGHDDIDRIRGVLLGATATASAPRGP